MAENTIKVDIISPDRIFYEGEATLVEIVTSEGEIGIYPGYIPMTNILKPGIMKVYQGNTVKCAALHEGFAEILPDKITILAETAEWPEEIDVERAKDSKERAKKRLSASPGSIDVARAELSLHRALIRIELAQRYK